MFSALFALCLIGGALAADGYCPEVEVVKDFDLSQYMGRWYEVRKYFMLPEVGARCIEADYSIGDNDTIVMDHSYRNLLGTRHTARAIAHVADPAEPAKLKIKYDMVPVGREGDYWILGTDYKTYAVVYSCRETSIMGVKYAWILTRERKPEDAVIDKAMEVAEKNQLIKGFFLKTRQTNCE